MDSDGRMARAGPPNEVSHGVTTEMTEALEALISCWQHASRPLSPQLSVLQLQALLVARRYPGINLTGMAREVGAAPPAASRLCDRLEAAGLLRREPAPTSRREIGLLLTLQGNDMLDTVFAQRAEWVGDVLSRMPPGSRRQLLTGLRAFVQAARPDDAGPSPHD
ncbi:MarR family winged helix-turn-helix transcriptional regulator [Streptomyces sp. NPDC001940]